ncbi:NACHT domain-containing protein [Acinetobacter variabilis]|uniref:NACHT domain-containing protein n=1 Tax=Acinetobacter variabilis TaxID=70346 RepID=UPI002897C7CA|nr:NACHT domain-containing protein [Acinetobacter variabilis]
MNSPFLERFTSYFLFSLNKNWLKDSRYAILLNTLEKDTPFTNLTQKALRWNEYYSYLNAQIDQPLFSENFSLRQIYIPLRAKTDKPITYNNSDNKGEIIVELEKEILEWLIKEDICDTIRLINGGPGSGKSSFLKMISTKIALETPLKVIFLPLHLISFNKSLDESINNYLSTIAGISYNELFELNERIVLIFDGLDELASQGEVGESVARDFSNELQRTLRLHNSQQIKVKAIVSGRDIVIQNEKKYLKVNGYELLPYYIENISGESDPFDIANLDQRDIWWEKYGKLKNIDINNIIDQIKSDNLKEITSQPLLNYLVAILLEVGGVKLNEQTTINQIYEHLLKEVYRRGWENHETYGPIQSICYEEFLMILQEISYTAWNNNGRTTSIKSIVEQCKYMNIDHILETFTKSLKTDEKSSLTKLLTAFYFKSNDNLENILDQTFEFTHKSFSDYLISLKTCKFLIYLTEDLNLSKKTSGGRGKNILEVTESFISYFKGSKLRDGNILQFLKNQFISIEDLDAIKYMLVEILKFISLDNDYKAIFSHNNLNRINNEFHNVYTNLIIILDIFCKLDDKKIDLNSSSVFSFIQKMMLKHDAFEGELLSNFVINNQLSRNVYYGAKISYAIRLLGSFNNFGFFSFFNHYLNCEIIYDNLAENSKLINGHGNYRGCSISVVNRINLSFLSCNFMKCNFIDIDELSFHESILFNVEFNNINKLYFDNIEVYKNVKFNGILIDDLNDEELEKIGIYIGKNKELI